jgi:hypothetical protein
MQVSQYIGAMPFLWLEVDSSAADQASRAFIERNSIALLTNFEREQLDPSSAQWLGSFCPRAKVRASGLWNQNHVDEQYDPAFLNRFASFVSQVGK